LYPAQLHGVLSFNQVLLAKLNTPVCILHLEELFPFHVTEPTADQVLSGNLDDGAVLSMLNGMNVTVRRDEDEIVLSSDYTNASKVVQADLTADNGVVHKLDRVLLPEFVVTDLTNVAKSTFLMLSALAEFANVGTLIEDEEFANVGTLIEDEEFTVFAPTIDAFLRPGNETLESYFDPDNVDSVVQMIFNHAVSGVYPSSLLDDGLSLENEARNPMMYSRSSNGSFMVNGANIVRVDILANNGIFRAIDKVSVPSIAPCRTRLRPALRQQPMVLPWCLKYKAVATQEASSAVWLSPH
jgi:transforming growth factor-beta-induced protein